MRPVNLLPPSQRIQAGGARPGSAYVLLGVLVALLVGVAAYVLSANQLTSKQDELARAEQQTRAAQAQAAGLASFDNFASIRATREQSVIALAGSRLDWERLMLELARVIPEDVYISSFDASAAGAPSSGGSDAAAPSGPSLTLGGCAPSHPGVATMMVRLRRLTGAGEVTLSDSSRSGGGESGGGGGGGSGCGEGVSFGVTVTFETPAAPATERVPADLGGGA